MIKHLNNFETVIHISSTGYVKEQHTIAPHLPIVKSSSLELQFIVENANALMSTIIFQPLDSHLLKVRSRKQVITQTRRHIHVIWNLITYVNFN